MTRQHPPAPHPADGSQRLDIDAGSADFKVLRSSPCHYAAKTAHLPRLLQGHGPLLLTRPRRSGKTLTLDTLRRFLEPDRQNPADTTAWQQLFSGAKRRLKMIGCPRFLSHLLSTLEEAAGEGQPCLPGGRSAILRSAA